MNAERWGSHTVLFVVVPPFIEDAASSCAAALPQQPYMSKFPYWQPFPSIILPFLHPSFLSPHIPFPCTWT